MVGNENSHTPVMVDEVVEYFGLPKAPLQHLVSIKDKKVFADLTLGAGGHASAIVTRGGLIIGIEADPELVKIARKTLNEVCKVYPACPADNLDESFIIFNDNFINLTSIVKNAGIDSLDGILIDLGVSSVHMDDHHRGFSFKNSQGDLDMRLNPGLQGVKASDLLNALPEDKLEMLFSDYMEFRSVKRLVGSIISYRRLRKIQTVGDFLTVIEKSGLSQKRSRKQKINVSTIPFMALRIAVNSELENLEIVLPKALSLLKKDGVFAVISFHSMEDKIVKDYFRNCKNNGKGMVLTEKPLVPKDSEIRKNPRSRSAKLRILKKL
ncbi:MAG TPA: 16S rRNA (cytosine(1402)-N(4))-methyltransferase RsmH [Patescibacteria group bacterium]|nr:16S rRNA (cytosine(1402)-N(4))-methyltransferase RsmH [Patescibacteria group bacterium]